MSPPSTAAGRSFLPTAMLLGLLVASVSLSVDPTLPSMPLIAAEFAVSDAAVQFSLSAFMAGVAGGQLFVGPLSDCFGRRPVVLAGLGLVLVTVLGCALSGSVTVLIGLRFLQGLGVCAAAVVARAVVRDLYVREEAARMYAYMMMLHGIAPIAGPILGAHLAVEFGWRAVYWFLSLYGLVALTTIWRALGETIVRRNPDAVRPRVLARTYRRVLSSRLFVGYVLSMTGCYCGLFAFLSASASTLITQFGVSVADYGYLFAACMSAYVVGNWISAKLVGRFSIGTMIMGGSVLIAIAGLTMAGLGLARVDTSAAVIVPMAGFMLAFCFIVPPAQAAAMSVFPEFGGAASSMIGFIQLAFSAATGAVVGHFADGTQVPMVLALGIASLFPFVTYVVIVRPKA